MLARTHKLARGLLFSLSKWRCHTELVVANTISSQLNTLKLNLKPYRVSGRKLANEGDLFSSFCHSRKLSDKKSPAPSPTSPLDLTRVELS